MKNTKRTNQFQLSIATGAVILVALLSFAFSPKQGGLYSVSLPDKAHFSDTSEDHSEIMIVDVSPRITDSGKCHFFLRDGDVLFVDPGYRDYNSTSQSDSGMVVQHFPGLVLNQNSTQIVNFKNLNHE